MEYERIGMSVCVLGLGYIGLPLAGILADRGVRVHGVDIRPDIVETLNRGEIHIHEKGLADLISCAVQQRMFTASTSPVEADLFVIAVPTPFTEGHAADIYFVRQAVDDIAPFVRPGNTVVLESTCPVGTAESVSHWLQMRRPDLYCPVRGEAPSEAQASIRIYVAYCPERVLPGNILKELIANDRVVGGIDPASAEKAALLYKRFILGEVFLTDSRTAEMCKLAENSYRDVNIAFANEISMICHRLDIDPYAMIKLANRHPRVEILQPGPGVGGHCIAVDPWFIVDSAPDLANLIRTAREVNDRKPHFVIDQVRALAADFASPTIACLGLTFKADVDDLRESPAVLVTWLLAEAKIGRIVAVEPHTPDLPLELADAGIRLMPLESALKAADIVVLLVNHREFLSIDPGELAGKKLLDTRGAWR